MTCLGQLTEGVFLVIAQCHCRIGRQILPPDAIGEVEESLFRCSKSSIIGSGVQNGMTGCGSAMTMPFPSDGALPGTEMRLRTDMQF